MEELSLKKDICRAPAGALQISRRWLPRLTSMEELSLKKAAKKIIKRAKKHPEWYSQGDVMYAKLVKKELKESERRKTDQCNS